MKEAINTINGSSDCQLPKSLVVMHHEHIDKTYGNEKLAEIAEISQLIAPPLSPDELNERPDLMKQVEVIFSGWNAPILNSSFLNLARNLKAVFYAAGSVRYMTSDELWKKGIILCGASAVNGETVADYTVGTVLFTLKRGFEYARITPNGSFSRSLKIAGINKSVVGLISLGAAGLATARKLAPFGVELVAYDPYFPREQADRLGIKMVDDLMELFRISEVVSLHAPLLDSTVGMINGNHISAMRAGTTFVNTARGAIVNEIELIEVLRKRPDIFAVLDVTDPEPPEPNSPLFTLPNVVLTPHIAGALGNDQLKMGESMVQEFKRWRNGEPLKYAINREQCSNMA